MIWRARNTIFERRGGPDRQPGRSARFVNLIGNLVNPSYMRDTFSSFLKAVRRGGLYDKVTASEDRGLQAQDPTASAESAP